jgi:DNA-damage-inducible protein D
MDDQKDIISLENIANENGSRFWYAHDFAAYLGYKDFDSFMKVIRKARASSEQIGIDTDSEFRIEEIKGKRTFKLTRFALFLCVAHADDTKPMVSQAKVALAKFANIALQSYSEHLERIEGRHKLTHGENYMGSVAKEHGLSQEKFGIFKNEGYRGMYNMALGDLKKYKGVKGSEVLYDYMGITELAANTFRVTQTAESIRQKNISTAKGMIDVAKSVGKEVRDMVIKNTGIPPEKLETEPKISMVKSKLKQTRKNMIEVDRKK